MLLACLHWIFISFFLSLYLSCYLLRYQNINICQSFNFLLKYNLNSIYWLRIYILFTLDIMQLGFVQFSPFGKQKKSQRLLYCEIKRKEESNLSLPKLFKLCRLCTCKNILYIYFCYTQSTSEIHVLYSNIQDRT